MKNKYAQTQYSTKREESQEVVERGMKKKKRWDVAAFTVAGGIFGTMIGWGIVYLLQR